ncbi:MAG: hypothetical protein OXE99_05350 [Cellvibrionales bacterium]|nr:hypothetical protein [Cellvibrionales bacterium]
MKQGYSLVSVLFITPCYRSKEKAAYLLLNLINNPALEKESEQDLRQKKTQGHPWVFEKTKKN